MDRRSAILALIVLLAPASLTQDRIAFAFADQAGTSLLTLDPLHQELTLEDARRFDGALCEGNQQLRVQFVKSQSRGTKDSGRATSYNFDHYPGFRFRLLDGKTRQDGNCLLAHHTYFAGKKPLAMKRWQGHGQDIRQQPDKCDKATQDSLPRLRGRAIVSCGVLAELAEGMRLLAVEYRRRGDSLLGAIMLKTADRLLVHEFPVISAWRVGDEGHWSAGNFVPLFALLNQRNGEVEIGVEWGAEEGGDLLIYRSEGNELQELKLGYRYWVPL